MERGGSILKNSDNVFLSISYAWPQEPIPNFGNYNLYWCLWGISSHDKSVLDLTVQGLYSI